MEKDELLKECGCCDPSSPTTETNGVKWRTLSTSYPTFQGLQNHLHLSIQDVFGGREKS